MAHWSSRKNYHQITHPASMQLSGRRPHFFAHTEKFKTLCLCFLSRFCDGFAVGICLKHRMKLNVCTYLEHECISMLALKTHFDYKKSSMHHALHSRLYCRINILHWSFIEALWTYCVDFSFLIARWWCAVKTSFIQLFWMLVKPDDLFDSKIGPI